MPILVKKNNLNVFLSANNFGLDKSPTEQTPMIDYKLQPSENILV